MGEARRVDYHPVVNSFWTIPDLTAPVAVALAACFVAAALLTLKRAAYGLAALIFVIPFDAMHAIGGTTVGIPKAVLLGTLVGLIPHVGSLRMALQGRARAVLGGFGLMLVPIVLGFAGAQHHGPVLRELLKWIEYAAYFVVATVAFADDPDDTLIFFAYASSIACVCATALVQEFIGSPWGIYFGSGIVPRISGALEGPNQLGGYLEIAVAVIGAWTMNVPRRVGLWLLGVVCVTLLLTFSRSAIAGVVVVVTILFAFHRKTVILWTVGAGCAIGAALEFLWSAFASRVAGASFLQSVTALSARPAQSGYAGGVGTRTQLWHAALAMFRAHPVFGVGSGNYELELAQYGTFGVRTHANSWYLQSLAEGGIIGLSATLALLALIVTSLWSRARESPWACAALAATAALALHQIVDYLFFYPKVAEPWVILVALGVTCPRRS